MQQSRIIPSVNRRTALLVGSTSAATVLAASSQAQSAASNQWWGWRGPTFDNHAAADAKAPSSIASNAIAWSIDLPGRGHSTPIVVDDSIYLTTADKAAGTQSVLAIGRTGKSRWGKTIHSAGIPPKNHNNNTEASPTLAYDGKALFASFYNSSAIRLTKLSTKGEIIWQKSVGNYSPNQFKYGYAASPLVYRDSIIINADYDGNAFLTAVDRSDGKIIWKVRRPGKISFSSPIVANLAGRDQLLLSGGDRVTAYDPKDGKTLWESVGATTMATCGTMVWDDKNVFASGGYPESETVCIAADGSGEIIWSNRTKCYEQSMISYDGYLYAAADSGVAYCWRGSDGKTMWKQRLGGKFSSSPLLVGDTIIVFSESGNGFAFAASPNSFQDRGQSRIADEIFSSPIIVGDTMYVRVANKSGRRQEKLLALR